MADTRDKFLSHVPWEQQVGYARAVRLGQQVFVSGCTAMREDGLAAGSDPYEQACHAIENVEVALVGLGASLLDVVRTRMFVTDIRRDWEAVGRAHREAFALVQPAASMVEVTRLIDERLCIEIEADAIIRGS